MVDHFTYLFNCTPVFLGSDYDESDLKLFIRWSRPELFMSVCQLTGVQLMIFFYPSIPVLFDNPGISKCLNTLFLFSPYLCFIIGFIYYSFFARHDSWMSQKTSTWTE